MQSKLHSKGYFLKDKIIWTYFKLEIISVTLNNWEIRGFLWQVAHIPKTETWKLVINVTVVWCIFFQMNYTIFCLRISSFLYLMLLLVFVQFSYSVMSDSLWPHESQHTRPPCPSPAPGVHPNSCASSWWCHPAISSSVVPFSSCP